MRKMKVWERFCRIEGYGEVEVGRRPAAIEVYLL